MLTIIPQLPALSSEMSGTLETKVFAVKDAYTDVATPAASIVGFNTSRTGTAGVYLMMTFKATTPYINQAYLYDAGANARTALTIAGAMDETVTTGYACKLVYSNEQDKFYLLSASATVAKIYPLTLSGTTLTIEADIDVSAGFTSKGNKLLMTCDKTDLYILDVADGAFKKYDLSAGSLGAALTAPAAEYYVTDNRFANFHYSDGNIYFLSGNNSNAEAATCFQKYNIAGNTWSHLSTAPAMSVYTADSVSVMTDVDDDAYVYAFCGTSNTNQPAASLWRYIPATDKWELVIVTNPLSPALQSYLAIAPAALWSYSPTSSALAGGMNAGVADFSEGDLINIHAAGLKVLNFGETWAKQTVLTYSGAGSLLGLQSLILTGSYSEDGAVAVNRNILFEITIDGGSTYEYNPASGDFAGLQSLNIPFSTSLSIKAMAGMANPNSTQPVVFVTALLNITS